MSKCMLIAMLMPINVVNVESLFLFTNCLFHSARWNDVQYFTV